MNYYALAKLVLTAGAALILLGIVFYLFGRFGGSALKIPGDIYVKKENYSIYFPIMSCILLSILITIILNLFGRR